MLYSVQPMNCTVTTGSIAAAAAATLGDNEHVSATAAVATTALALMLLPKLLLIDMRTHRSAQSCMLPCMAMLLRVQHSCVLFTHISKLLLILANKCTLQHCHTTHTDADADNTAGDSPDSSYSQRSDQAACN
jgi:hypothetical protein